MKDLGEPAYILGIHIYSDRYRRLIELSQSIYLDKVLKMFNIEDSIKGSLPQPKVIISFWQTCAYRDMVCDALARKNTKHGVPTYVEESFTNIAIK
jgi:hypothetical protein